MKTLSAKEAKQRHHDYYVRLYREGKLTEEDQPQFELAIKREKAGEVKPIKKRGGIMNKLSLVVEFPWLFIKHIFNYRVQRPNDGIVASFVLFGFTDIDEKGKLTKPHGVAAFFVDPEMDDSSLRLWGPFGWEKNTSFYGRDTWGRVTQTQLALQENGELLKLSRLPENRGKDILLVGVRSFNGWHPWPLSDHTQFVLCE